MADSPDRKDDVTHAEYWRTNIKVMLVLIAVWFIASFGLSILAVDWLDQFKVGGFPLGFWMAQQGSIIVFLIVIACYVVLMNRIDKKHGVEEELSDSQDYEI